MVHALFGQDNGKQICRFCQVDSIACQVCDGVVEHAMHSKWDLRHSHICPDGVEVVSFVSHRPFFAQFAFMASLKLLPAYTHEFKEKSVRTANNMTYEERLITGAVGGSEDPRRSH